MLEPHPNFGNSISTENWDDGCIHVWMGDLARLSVQRPELKRHLDKAERERAAHYYHATDRDYFIASRGQLRELLSRCVGVLPHELNIAYTPRGKPFLPDHTDWHFNVSHSRNYALWAISYGRQVGIDIERVQPDILLDSLIPRTLCEREQLVLSQHQGEKLPLFLQFWTRKEAFLKAVGDGLSVPLVEMDASNSNGQISLWHSPTSTWRPEEKWSAHPLTTFPDCIASLVAHGQDWKVTPHQL